MKSNILAACAVALGASAMADDGAAWNVRFVSTPELKANASAETNSVESTILGHILTEAADGGILLEDQQGRLWNITPAELLNRTRTGDRFVPFTQTELAAALTTELGDRFHIVTTEHYVIATSGSRVHAEWTGALLERLQQAFLKFWRNEGWVLMPPTAPLTVVIHGTRADYAAAARSEGGAALIDAHGYYSMRTNRIVLADPTADAKQSLRTVADVQRFVASDSSSLSTIAHEATHQIAFNCGVHTRYADNPVWMTEGLAMMFEIPDSSGSGWKTVGRINRPRLSRFRQSLKDSRTPGALTALIADDERFRNPETAEEAYAEAWAFTSFLMRTRRREWTAYLQECSENTRMRWKTRDERTADFERAFGLTAADLESEFLRYVSRLR